MAETIVDQARRLGQNHCLLEREVVELKSRANSLGWRVAQNANCSDASFVKFLIRIVAGRVRQPNALNGITILVSHDPDARPLGQRRCKPGANLIQVEAEVTPEELISELTESIT